MKQTLQLITLAAFFCTVAVAEDELDAALAALKNKAPRRTYSASAILQNRDLVVPARISDEEKLLDAKIRALDKIMDSDTVGMNHRALAPRPVSATFQQENNNNWLTPALLDDNATENSPADQKASWITQELDRQKLIQMEKTALEENTDLIAQQLRGESRSAEGAQYDQLQSYDGALRDILSGSVPETRRSSSATQIAPLKKTTFGVSSFSSIDRSTPTVQPGSFSSSVKPPQHMAQFGEISQKNPSETTSIWDTPATEPLTPLKRLQQRSPLNSDPFVDDYMSKTKRSIWD